MAGLLADVFSFGDTAKRKVKGLLADPVGTLQQFVGNENDRAGRINELTYAAAAEQGMGPQSKKLAGLLADSYNPTGMFIGATAKTWDKAAAEKAQKLLKAGADPKQVWKETGTFKGADGALRQEIDDSGSSLLAQLPSPQRVKEITGKWMTNDDFLRAAPDTPEALAIRTRNSMTQGKLNGDSPRLPATLDHQALYAAYPSTGSIRMAVKNDMPIGEGAYAQDMDSIILSPLQGPELRSVKLHEIQHAIQQREGWAKGGMPEGLKDALADDALKLRKQSRMLDESAWRNDPLGPAELLKPGARKKALELEQQASTLNSWVNRIDEFGDGYAHKAYQSLAGEAEARATQARMNMNAAQRREVYPFDSYDVPVDQLIVRGGLLGN